MLINCRAPSLEVFSVIITKETFGAEHAPYLVANLLVKKDPGFRICISPCLNIQYFLFSFLVLLNVTYGRNVITELG